MNKAIWKFVLNNAGATRIKFLAPTIIKYLRVDRQGDNLCLWAEVDVGSIKTIQYLIIRATGEVFETDDIHIGTFFDGPFVWHMYREE